MKIKYSDWQNHLNSISQELDGQLKIIKAPSLGDEREYFNSEFLIEYKKRFISISQLFIKRDYENGFPQKLNLKYEFENRGDFFYLLTKENFLTKFLDGIELN